MRSIALILTLSLCAIGSSFASESSLEGKRTVNISQNTQAYIVKDTSKLSTIFGDDALLIGDKAFVPLPSARANKMAEGKYLLLEISPYIEQSVGMKTQIKKGKPVPKLDGKVPVVDFTLEMIEINPILNNGGKPINSSDYLRILKITDYQHILGEKSPGLLKKILEGLVEIPQPKGYYSAGLGDTISQSSKGLLEEIGVIGSKKKNKTIQCGSIGQEGNTALWFLSAPKTIYALLQVAPEVANIKVDFELGVGFKDKLPQGGNTLFISTKTPLSEFRREPETFFLDKVDVKIDFLLKD
jgi:hypothetical protein